MDQVTKMNRSILKNFNEDLKQVLRKILEEDIRLLIEESTRRFDAECPNNEVLPKNMFFFNLLNLLHSRKLFSEHLS